MVPVKSFSWKFQVMSEPVTSESNHRSSSSSSNSCSIPKPEGLQQQ